jgi:hypothetical protein
MAVPIGHDGLVAHFERANFHFQKHLPQPQAV